MKNIFAVLLAFAVVFILLMSDYGDDRVRVYDCSMSEWHLDIPVEVKQECRRRQYEHYKQEQKDKIRMDV
jgi:hypothetical protein